MKKKLRVLILWILISLILQFSTYTILNHMVAKVIAPPKGASSCPITTQLKATIPGVNLENVQVSYDKTYLAYKQNDELKIFDLKKQKVVFQKAPPSGSGSTMGVLNYQWLPDRDTLLYFYAKPNPNPVTTIVVQDKQSEPQVNSNAAPQVSTPSTNTMSQLPQTDDPFQNAGKAKSSTSRQTAKTTSAVQSQAIVTTKAVTKKIYNNPQITELYSLELPEGNDLSEPDDRFNQDIDNFPAGGEIEQIVVSTYTNLLYLTVKSGDNASLLEIGVMKHVHNLSQAGETITNMVASDHYGTLYMDINKGNENKIDAYKNGQRKVVTNNPNDLIFGDRSGTLYLGQVKDKHLVKVLSAVESSDTSASLDFQTEWQGSIPFDDNDQVIIGAHNQVIVYDNSTANIIANGKLEKVTLQGEENYITPDGAELVQLTHQGDLTLAELRPFK